jgi:hypothetical protein
MRRTPWFERRFAAIDDNGLLPGILERLEGTTARLRSLLAGFDRAPAAVIPGGVLRRRSDTS